MDSESFFVEVFRRVAKSVVAWLASEPQGLIVSIDVGGSFFDCIASNAAPNSGLEFVHSPSLLRYRSRLWDCRMAMKPSDVIDEPILFGRTDGRMQTVDDADLARNYSLSAGTFGTRSIDAWIRGRPKLRFVHFGDRSLILAHIEGAAATLARDRPLLTLYPPVGRDRSALFSRLLDLGYRVFNLGYAQVEANEEGLPLDFGWIGVPTETGFALKNDGNSPTDRGNRARLELMDSRMSDRNAMPRQRQSGEVFGLERVALPETERLLTMAEVAVCNDCDPVESGGGLLWRWLGPGVRSRIAIPCPFPGTYSFEATVMSCRVPNGLRNCRILVDGREVPTSVQGEEKGTIGFVGHLSHVEYGGYVEVDFVSFGSPPPIGSDSRVLRTSLASIQVRQCP